MTIGRVAYVVGVTVSACAYLVLMPAQSLALQFTAAETAQILRHSPLPPLLADPSNEVASDEKAARLGQFLFYDARFSADGKTSCSTCHDPRRGWSNESAVGDVHSIFPRNVPTLWNTAYNRWFFWDGRADSQWSQALAPLENVDEHGGNRLQFAHLVAADPELNVAYVATFGPLPDVRNLPPHAKPVPSAPDNLLNVAWMTLHERERTQVDRVFSNLGKAIAAYERKIVSGNSPFDRFAGGLHDGDTTRTDFFSESARRGLRIFVGKGKCSLCHSGPNFSDGEFHNLGLSIGRNKRLDPGRYRGITELTVNPFNRLSGFSSSTLGALVQYLIKSTENLGQFKTPTLRNVEASFPYMHDGRFTRLRDVVEFYSTRDGAVPVGHGENILEPLHLSDAEIDDVVAFLISLSGPPLDRSLIGAPRQRNRKCS